MNKVEWNKRRDSLKELLDQIPVVAKPKTKQLTCYMFGAQHHTQSNTWYIYNITTNNCIAGVKRFGDKSVIRYRANSWWAPTLKAYKYDPLTLHAPSTTLGRWRNWLQKGVHQTISASTDHDRRVNEIIMGTPANTYWSNVAVPSFAPQIMRTRDSNGRLRDSRGRFARDYTEIQLPSFNNRTSRSAGATLSERTLQEMVDSSVWLDQQRVQEYIEEAADD